MARYVLTILSIPVPKKAILIFDATGHARVNTRHNVSCGARSQGPKDHVTRTSLELKSGK
jgi:hypothetical protein